MRKTVKITDTAELKELEALMVEQKELARRIKANLIQHVNKVKIKA